MQPRGKLPLPDPTACPACASPSLSQAAAPRHPCRHPRQLANLGILQQVFEARDGDGAITGVLPAQRLLQLPQLLFSFPHIREKLWQQEGVRLGPGRAAPARAWEDLTLSAGGRGGAVHLHSGLGAPGGRYG